MAEYLYPAKTMSLRMDRIPAIAKANVASVLSRRGKVQSLLTSQAKNFTGAEVAAG